MDIDLDNVFAGGDSVLSCDAEADRLAEIYLGGRIIQIVDNRLHTLLIGIGECDGTCSRGGADRYSQRVDGSPFWQGVGVEDQSAVKVNGEEDRIEPRHDFGICLQFESCHRR